LRGAAPGASRLSAKVSDIPARTRGCDCAETTPRGSSAAYSFAAAGTPARSRNISILDIFKRKKIFVQLSFYVQGLPKKNQSF